MNLTGLPFLRGLTFGTLIVPLAVEAQPPKSLRLAYYSVIGRN